MQFPRRRAAAPIRRPCRPPERMRSSDATGSGGSGTSFTSELVRSACCASTVSHVTWIRLCACIWCQWQRPVELTTSSQSCVLSIFTFGSTGYSFAAGHGVAHCSLRGLRSVVGEHAASPLAPFAGRNCWAIRSVLDEPTICYRTSRFRRPKTISHDDTIAASCASSLYSGRGREADVLMYQASLSARAFSIAKLFAPSCTVACLLVRWKYIVL